MIISRLGSRIRASESCMHIGVGWCGIRLLIVSLAFMEDINGCFFGANFAEHVTA